MDTQGVEQVASNGEAVGLCSIFVASSHHSMVTKRIFFSLQRLGKSPLALLKLTKGKRVRLRGHVHQEQVKRDQEMMRLSLVILNFRDDL